MRGTGGPCFPEESSEVFQMDLNGHQGQHISLKSGVERLALGDHALGDAVAPRLLEGSPVRQLERDRSGLAGLLADSQAAEETRNIMGEDDASGFLPALHLFDGRSVKPRLPQLLSVAVMASGFPLSKQDRGKWLPFSKASSGRRQVDPWKWTPPW